MRFRVRPTPRLAGSADVPGDKSVSHRAALLGALAVGTTEIHGYLEAQDCLRTITAVQALGAEVTRKGPGQYRIEGCGRHGLREPSDVIDCGNSGTSARLLVGLLAGQPFWTMLTGDESLRTRPMGRVAEPLRRMGAATGPVALMGPRMGLLVAAGSAEELPGLLDWLEWGGISLDLAILGADGRMTAPLPPGRGGSGAPGAATWLRAPAPGREVESSLPALRSAPWGVAGAPCLPCEGEAAETASFRASPPRRWC